MTSARFEHTIPVRYHQLDLHGRLKPVMLLNYLQDVAGLHARQLGISVVDLRKLGVTWVISRIHLAVKEYPRGDEDITIATWPSSRSGLFSCREFELYNRERKVIGCATTSWAVLDMASRRPVNPDRILPRYPLDPVRAVQDDFESLPPFPEDDDYRHVSFRVLRSDLDSNHHVNNTVFAGWALESAPDNVAAGMLTELEISYRAEVLYGDTVCARCIEIEPDVCLHQIVNRADGRELARMRSRWKDL